MKIDVFFLCYLTCRTREKHLGVPTLIPTELVTAITLDEKFDLDLDFKLS